MGNLFNRLIDSLLTTVDDDPDFPTPEKLALLRRSSRAEAESPRLLYGRLLDELNESLLLEDKAKEQKNPRQYALIAWRERRKLTQAEAAKRLAMSFTIYRYYEVGYLKVSDTIIARFFRQERHIALTMTNPTLLRAAARIQIDFPDDFLGYDVERIEEKLRTGRSSLRTKYWRQIIEASIADDLGPGRPLPNCAVGPRGRNPLADAIKKGAELVVSVSPESDIVPGPKVEAKPGSLSIIQLTLIWIAVILCVRALKTFID